MWHNTIITSRMKGVGGTSGRKQDKSRKGVVMSMFLEVLLQEVYQWGNEDAERGEGRRNLHTSSKKDILEQVGA